MNSKILIIDDHGVFTDGLCSLFGKYKRYQVVGVVKYARDVFDKYLELSPNIILMDYNLSDGNGLDEAIKILEHDSNMKIIMISMHQRESLIKKVKLAGLAGFLNKTIEFNEIIEALNSIHKGEFYLDKASAQWLEKGSSSEVMKDLTKRENQIFMMLAQAWPNKMIADDLQISAKTVEFHRKNLMNKLDVTSLVELSHFAINEGFIDPIKKE